MTYADSDLDFYDLRVRLKTRCIVVRSAAVDVVAEIGGDRVYAVVSASKFDLNSSNHSGPRRHDVTHKEYSFQIADRFVSLLRQYCCTIRLCSILYKNCCFLNQQNSMFVAGLSCILCYNKFD